MNSWQLPPPCTVLLSLHLTSRSLLRGPQVTEVAPGQGFPFAPGRTTHRSVGAWTKLGVQVLVTPRGSTPMVMVLLLPAVGSFSGDAKMSQSVQFTFCCNLAKRAPGQRWPVSAVPRAGCVLCQGCQCFGRRTKGSGSMG